MSCYFGGPLVLSSKLLICSENSSKPITPLLRKSLILSPRRRLVIPLRAGGLPSQNRLPTLPSWNERPCSARIICLPIRSRVELFFCSRIPSVFTPEVGRVDRLYPSNCCCTDFCPVPDKIAGESTALLKLLNYYIKVN